MSFVEKETNLKGEVANQFVGLSDAPKFDIIRTENGDVIYRFIPEIMTF